jgi:hypothetical protein
VSVYNHVQCVGNNLFNICNSQTKKMEKNERIEDNIPMAELCPNSTLCKAVVEKGKTHCKKCDYKVGKMNPMYAVVVETNKECPVCDETKPELLGYPQMCEHSSCSDCLRTIMGYTVESPSPAAFGCDPCPMGCFGKSNCFCDAYLNVVKEWIDRDPEQGFKWRLQNPIAQYANKYVCPICQKSYLTI